LSNAVADEQLAMLPVVKAFGTEAAMTRRFEGVESEARELSKRLHFAVAVVEPLSQLLAALAAVVLLWTLTGDVVGGRLSLTGFLVFLMYAFVFVRPLSTLAATFGAVSRTWGSAERIARLLAEPLEVNQGQDVTELREAIRFEQVTFGYRGRAE